MPACAGCRTVWQKLACKAGRSTVSWKKHRKMMGRIGNQHAGIRGRGQPWPIPIGSNSVISRLTSSSPFAAVMGDVGVVSAGNAAEGARLLKAGQFLQRFQHSLFCGVFAVDLDIGKSGIFTGDAGIPGGSRHG